MKNAILITLLFAALNCFAQDKTNFGFKAGVTVSSPKADIASGYSDNSELSLENGVSFLIGGYIDLVKDENLMISPELYFHRKTSSIEYKLKNTSGNTIYRVSGDASADYLVFGLEGKYFFNKDSYLPYLILEPRLTFYLGDDIDNTNVPVQLSTKNYISERYKKLGFGMNTGFGMKFVKEKGFNLFFEVLICPDFFYSYDDNAYRIKNTGFEIKTGIGL